jgi:hypothetical protein
MTTVRIVSRRAVAALAIVAVASVGACTSGTSPSALASAVANASLPPVASATATTSPSTAPASEAPSESALPSAVATDIDPCQLITSADASALTGVTFGAGKESTENNVRMCTYAAPGPNLFSVEVAIAPDVATAKAAEAAQEKDLQTQASDLASLGLTVTKLPNFAPNTDAALMQGGMSAGGQSIAARAMFVLRNVTFFGFSDVAVNGGQPPSEQKMKDEAMTLLGKLP